MYAIVNIAGNQEKVSAGDIILSNKIKAKPGETIQFDQVLLISDGEKTEIGTPHVKNARVEAEILGDTQGKKLIVFKFKRRKDSMRRIGFRADYTKIKIKNIISV